MNQRALVVALLGLATFTAACHKKAPPVTQPAAQPPPPPPPGPVNNPPPPPPPPPSAPPRDVAAERARLTNTLADRIHFEYDKFEILAGDTPKLDQKAAILKRNNAVRIRITGHCDERGSDEYNIALGMRRATQAKEYLVRQGIDASRIEVATLGREVPLDAGKNEGAYAANRRDEFEVIAGAQTLGTNP